MNENDGSYNHCNTVTRARVFSVTWFYEPSGPKLDSERKNSTVVIGMTLVPQ